MHDGKGFVLIGLNLGGLPATVGIIDDENGDIRPILIAQVVNFVHVSMSYARKLVTARIGKAAYRGVA